jgi:alkylated DNA repair dioxygenase AlkB
MVFGGILQEIFNRQGFLHYQENFIEPAIQHDLFTMLKSGLQWRQDHITLFGKTHPVPRLQAWYGDPEIRYKYSGISLEPLAWTKELSSLRVKLQNALSRQFNAVLCNYYRHGQDYAAWHSDNEKELGQDPFIASLSLGGKRRFDIRHKSSGETHSLWLSSGSLVVMGGSVQTFWKHQLAKTRRPVDERINLTFRLVLE